MGGENNIMKESVAVMWQRSQLNEKRRMSCIHYQPGWRCVFPGICRRPVVSAIIMQSSATEGVHSVARNAMAENKLTISIQY
jgi:hypothetical protein